MVKHTKVLIFVLILTMILSTGMTSFAEYDIIYEDIKSTQISTGVTHEEIRKFTDKGWFNINVMRIDLDDPYTNVTVFVSDESIQKKERLSVLANNTENSVTAVNGDFFDPPMDTALGPMVIDNEVITTGIGDPQFASFNITTSGMPFITYWDTMNFSVSNGSYTLPITYINKPYLGYDRSIIYDNNWSTTSYGNTYNGDIVEVLVVDNTIKKIQYNKPPMDIPEDGYVISSVGNDINYVLDNLSVGDDLTVNIDVNFDQLETSIGGGSQLVNNGIIAPVFTNDIAGRHPRTAVGISKDKSEVILVTVDGRTLSYTGMSQYELSELMIELGAYNALNLDGGGSTEMVYKELGNETVTIANSPSDGSERRIHNGLGVVSDTPEGETSNLVLYTSDNRMFVDTSRTFHAKGIDQYYKPATLDPDDIVWSVSGIDGYFEDNKLYAKSGGTATVTAEYNGFKQSTTVEVYEHLVDMAIKPDFIHSQINEVINLSVVGLNESGHTAIIDPSDLTWHIPENLGHINDEGQFVASSSPGQGIAEVTSNGVTLYVPIVNGKSSTLLYDFNTPNGSFLGYPDNVTGKYSTVKYGEDGNMVGRLQYDFTKPGETKAAYLVFDDGGIPLPDNADGIGLWVMGDYGNNHWLRGKVADANGNTVNIDFARSVDWEGWQYVEASIPDNLEGPLTLTRVYLVETDPSMDDYGVVLMNNMTVLHEPDFDMDVPDNINQVANIEDFIITSTEGYWISVHGKIDYEDKKDLSGQFNWMNTLTSNESNIFIGSVDDDVKKELKKQTSYTSSGDYSETLIGGSMFINMNNFLGSIRSNDYTQWTKFLNTIERESFDNLVITLTHDLFFIDSMEEELFFDTLEKLWSEGKGVYVIYPGGDVMALDRNSGANVINMPTYTVGGNQPYQYLQMNIQDGKLSFEMKTVQ